MYFLSTIQYLTHFTQAETPKLKWIGVKNWISNLSSLRRDCAKNVTNKMSNSFWRDKIYILTKITLTEKKSKILSSSGRKI